jgi:hypothetical protein
MTSELTDNICGSVKSEESFIDMSPIAAFPARAMAALTAADQEFP